ITHRSMICDSGKADHDLTDLLRLFVRLAVSQIRRLDNKPVRRPRPGLRLLRPRLASDANVGGASERLSESAVVLLGSNTAHFPRVKTDWRSRLCRHQMCPHKPRFRRLDTWVSYPAGTRR